MRQRIMSTLALAALALMISACGGGTASQPTAAAPTPPPAAPTDAPTLPPAPTEAPTEASGLPPAPTEMPTDAPTLPPAPTEAPTDAPTAPLGDPAQGQQVFSRGCNACHTTSTRRLVGPGLAGLFEPGGPELPSGVDYGGNLPNGQPITDANVADWIRSGGRGQIGVMPAGGNVASLTDADIDNLIAYLKTLKK